MYVRLAELGHNCLHMMRTMSPSLIPADAVPGTAAMDLAAPRWALELVGPAVDRPVVDGGRLEISVAAGADFSLITARVREIDSLPPAEVEQATAGAYSAIAEQLSSVIARHPVRFWNYIPAIHRPSGRTAAGEQLDRYMAFNAGRYTACSRWLGGEDSFPRLLATASGVGHGGQDLVIHALAAAVPGVAVENPRQVPAYRYSRRYGPKPPCFARATVLKRGDGRSLILVGGTASVRGEASVHIGDLPAQFNETLENLTALLQAATGSGAADTGLFTDVRVYYVRTLDLPALTSVSKRAFRSARCEFVAADLCRSDLLVEIEGVASAAVG